MTNALAYTQSTSR